MRRLRLPLFALLLLSAQAAFADDFTYYSPGDLINGSGEGRVDDVIYAPGMRFPIESAPAFANSQVYNPGGYLGPAGSQCDAVNFQYPWRDNYCEIRDWDMPLCPAGKGHQGQDIRAASCDPEVHWAVAAVDGTITSIGSYSVYLTAADGTRYDYLHMGQVQVSVGDTVTRGQRIGKVSNEFGGTSTTVHLHFNLQQYVEGVGTVYVPPYTSLIASYKELVGPPPGTAEGALESVDCQSISGYAWQSATPDNAIDVRLSFDAEAGSLDAAEVTLLANEERPELCDSLGSCAHGFSSRIPLSLEDDSDHAVYAYGLDAEGGGIAALGSSPTTLHCKATLPEGDRRLIGSYAEFLGWGFSAFWDIAPIDEAVVDALPKGAVWPEKPVWLRAIEGTVYLVDGEILRALPKGAEAAWHIDTSAIVDATAEELDAYTPGKPLGQRPTLVQGSETALYVIDAAPNDESPPPINPWQDGSEASAEADASCGCEVPGAPSHTPSLWVVGAGLGLWLARRRRSQRAGSAP